MKTRVTIILVFVFAAVAVLVLLMQPKGSIDETIATVRYIKAGHVNIACEDAEAIAWLIPDLIKEREEQVAAYEAANGPITDEEMREKIYYGPTETLETLHIWNNEVMHAIEQLFEKDSERQDVLYDSIINDFGYLYSLMSGVYYGEMKATEADTIIQQTFCSDGHNH